MSSPFSRLPPELHLEIASHLQRVPDYFHLLLATRHLYQLLLSSLLPRYCSAWVTAHIRFGPNHLPTHALFHSPLHHAVQHSDTLLLRAFLAGLAGTRPLPLPASTFIGGWKDTELVRPLLVAVINHNVEAVRLLLQYGDTSFEPGPQYYDKPSLGSELLHAVAGGEMDMVRLLLEAGATPRTVFGDFYDAPVLCAVVRGEAEMLGLMVDVYPEAGAARSTVLLKGAARVKDIARRLGNRDVLKVLGSRRLKWWEVRKRSRAGRWKEEYALELESGLAEVRKGLLVTARSVGE